MAAVTEALCTVLLTALLACTAWSHMGVQWHRALAQCGGLMGTKHAGNATACPGHCSLSLQPVLTAASCFHWIQRNYLLFLKVTNQSHNAELEAASLTSTLQQEG